MTKAPFTALAAAALLAFLAFMATFGLGTIALLWAGRRRGYDGEVPRQHHPD